MKIEGLPFRDGGHSSTVSWARSKNGKTLALIFWPGKPGELYHDYPGKLIIGAPRYFNDRDLVKRLEVLTGLVAVV